MSAYIEPTSWVHQAHGVAVRVMAGSEGEGVVRVTFDAVAPNNYKALRPEPIVVSVDGWRDRIVEPLDVFARRVARRVALAQRVDRATETTPEIGKWMGQAAIDLDLPLSYLDMTDAHVEAWDQWLTRVTSAQEVGV